MTRRPSTSSARRAAWSASPRASASRATWRSRSPCPVWTPTTCRAAGTPPRRRSRLSVAKVLFVNPVIRAGDDVLTQVVQADDWDVIALGGITTAYGAIKHIVGLAKALAPRALVVAGGGFLTSMPHDVMRLLPQVDVGVVGEAFLSFPELLRRVDAGNRDWASVRGLVWRDAAGTSHLTPEQPLLDDIDRLPYPAWELFPLDIYFRNSTFGFSEEGMAAKRRLDINASYGCSLICRFCFHLGIAGDMEYVQKDGQPDVRFG